MPTLRDRARGCLLGCLVGDALGSQVEFQAPSTIQRRYPEGLRELGPSPVWGTLAGQPTDDGELLLALAGSIATAGAYDPAAALAAYRAWHASGPFDCGATVAAGRAGHPNHVSEANGALMRQAPLAVWASAFRQDTMGAVWSAFADDTRLTHPNPVCVAASVAHLTGLILLLRGNSLAHALAGVGASLIEGGDAEVRVQAAIEAAAAGPPDCLTNQGWVLVALQNAWYQALHADNFEAGLVDTVMRGGDTDTNACIAGGLLGALYGEAGIPAHWREVVLTCRPDWTSPRPRPARYWPGRVIELADRLLAGPPTAPSADSNR